MGSDCSSYFPPEILNVVIDHLHDGTNLCLVVCGLACRPLIYRARICKLSAQKTFLFESPRQQRVQVTHFLENATSNSFNTIKLIMRASLYYHERDRIGWITWIGRVGVGFSLAHSSETLSEFGSNGIYVRRLVLTIAPKSRISSTMGCYILYTVAPWYLEISY